MLLSPEERARLEELEKQLSIEDPGLARTLRFGADRQPPTADTVPAILSGLAGVLLLLVGIATQFTAVGVIGFLAMHAGLYWFVQKRWPENRSWQQRGPEGTASAPD